MCAKSSLAVGTSKDVVLAFGMLTPCWGCRSSPVPYRTGVTWCHHALVIQSRALEKPEVTAEETGI